ncbi:diacylglycerol kinase [Marinicella pacifica]|uniref:Diacylglycerol kinase n=2 Tax=Marinicella pacifica TaxID=1171543 RepID=A0A917FQC8_9GAMM|nr:diacylglycerol kinase family protein [Marinicella pacifica]GGF94554.1 diacylglycerol kinase [Marinicella pacifica]
MKNMKPLLIIYNPHAGSGQAEKQLPDIEAYLTKNGLDYVLKITGRPKDVRNLVTQSELNHYSAVIGAGGDGTLFEVVNALMRVRPEQRLPLGVLPVGTGNAFSRELGLKPSDWKKAIDIIQRNNPKPVDVGKVQTSDQQYYFINIVGIGLVVNIGQTTQKIKKLGPVSYSLAALWETMRIKPNRVKISIDGELIEDNLVFVEIANSRYTGTSFKIAPDAQIDDGFLDIILLKPIARWRILNLFPTIYSGRHIEHPEIETHRGKTITLTTTEPMPLMPDGEFIGHTPATITCESQALQLLSI